MQRQLAHGVVGLPNVDVLSEYRACVESLLAQPLGGRLSRAVKACRLGGRDNLRNVDKALLAVAADLLVGEPGGCRACRMCHSCWLLSCIVQVSPGKVCTAKTPRPQRFRRNLC